MKAVKGVKFTYKPTSQTLEFLSTFRDMVNEAIAFCLSEKIRGRLGLRDRIYKEFQEKFGDPVLLPLLGRRSLRRP